MSRYAVSASRKSETSQGFVVKNCGSHEHYWLNSKQMYQCKSCSFRTSLRSGTIMEASKLPFRYWFVAIWLMGCSKKGSSACNVQRQLNHKRYEPIWAMMHKNTLCNGQNVTTVTYWEVILSWMKGSSKH